MNTPSRDRTGRRVAGALRAIAALAALLALIAGLPALLWLFTGALLPHGVTLADLGALFTQHEDVGAPFLAVLIATGWTGWAAFALCVVLEVPSQLRGRPTVSLPAFGAPQRLAALLVGAILVILPTTSALATTVPAHAATARPLICSTAPLTASPVTPPTAPATALPTGSTESGSHLHYTVKDRDSLWSIAQHELGDGAQWKNIAQLNSDRTMNDGTTFNADTIQPGWALLLPCHANAPTSSLVQGANVSAAPAPAITTTSVTAVASPAPTPGMPSAGANTAGEQAGWPTHTVQSPTETPWDLAVRYLGDGQRWPDIAALNPQVPDIAAGNHQLPQGAVITLPADARPTTPAALPPAAPAANPAVPQPQATDRAAVPGAHNVRAPTHVTVREGDNLSSIAEHAYGDPTQWPAIFAANKGETQPGGEHFTNPDLIYPGQDLNLLAAAQAAPPADTTTPAASAMPPNTGPATPQKPDSTTADPAPQPSPGQDPAQPSVPANPAAPTTPPAAAPSSGGTLGPAASPSAQAGAPALASAGAQGPAAVGFALAPAVTWLGAGALAAALLGSVALLRRLQQRRVRPGRHIPLPSGRAAATEQSLRAAQHSEGFELLDRSLRTLALNLAAASRELPVVEAVVVHESRVDLHLSGEPVPAPMKPFTAAPGRGGVWTCSASSPDLADEDALTEADTPYPALVSIGWDEQKHLVLVDLEHVGVLNLAGDPHFARHVLQAIAVELATTPLPGHLEIAALAHTAPGLEDAAPGRITRTDDPARAAADLLAHTASQRRALTSVGANNLRTARLSEEAGDAWTPRIVLAEHLPAGYSTSLITDAINEQPPTASAVVTTNFDQDGAGGWTLTCQHPDETVALPGSGLVIHLQGLSDEHYADAIEILTLASSDTDVPAPDWITQPLDDYTDDEDEQPVAAAFEVYDLPAEYADLEQDILGEDPHAASVEESEAAPATPTSPPVVTGPASDNGDEELSGPSLADILAEEDDNHDTVVQPPEPAKVPAAPVLAPTRSSVPAPPATADIPALPRERQPTDNAGSGPSVLLLGPIAIEGAAGQVDSNRRRTSTELIAYLALNPGFDHHALDNALWPGQNVSKQVRNAVISRTRAWLGADPDGSAHFPRVQDTGDNRYRLARTVTCDWTLFQRHSRQGLADHGEDGDLALRRALALVRGQPFAGTDSGRYAWAEHAIQGMISEITAAAHELSTRRLEARDTPGALWAARQGLRAAQENETLHRCLFRAHHAAGDIDALRASAAHLARINHELGDIDMESETSALLQNLLPDRSLSADMVG